MNDWPWLKELVRNREYDLTVSWEAEARQWFKNSPEFYWTWRKYMFNKGYRGF